MKPSRHRSGLSLWGRLLRGADQWVQAMDYDPDELTRHRLGQLEARMGALERSVHPFSNSLSRES